MCTETNEQLISSESAPKNDAILEIQEGENQIINLNVEENELQSENIANDIEKYNNMGNKLIKRELEKNLPEIENYLKQLRVDKSISGITKFCCEKFGFVDQKNCLQIPGCYSALMKLQEEGKIDLGHKKNEKPDIRNPRCKNFEIEQYQGSLTSQIIQALFSLVLVTTPNFLEFWNSIFYQEDGQKPAFDGCCLKYLLCIGDFIIGILLIRPSSLNLSQRDTFFNMTPEVRKKKIKFFVDLDYIFFRETVKDDPCMGEILEKIIEYLMFNMPADYSSRYGYTPLVMNMKIQRDSLLDEILGKKKFEYMGENQNNSNELYYFYVYNQNYKRILGLPEDAAFAPIDYKTCLDQEGVTAEFENCQLGHKKRTDALVAIANEMFKNPGNNYCEIAQGDTKKLSRFYGLIESPHDEVSFENIINEFIKETLRRCKSLAEIIAVQDTIEFTFNTLGECTGLRVVGNNQTNSKSFGLKLHLTTVYTVDGIFLGVLYATFIDEIDETIKELPEKYKMPEDKESYRWVDHYLKLVEYKRYLPNTTITHVSDRESDMTLLLYINKIYDGCINLVIRAKHNRIDACTNKKIFDAVKKTGIKARYDTDVPRQSKRKKLSGKQAKQKRRARKAEINVRYMEVNISTKDVHGSDNEPIKTTLIYAEEAKKPRDGEKINWYLLSSKPITTGKEAIECVLRYRRRWKCEEFHRILKSGCSVEKARNMKANRLKRIIGINLVIAWKIMLLCQLGKEFPDLPLESAFTKNEQECLKVVAKEKNYGEVKNLGDGVRVIAKLGGWVGRNNDAPFGFEVVWKGLKVFYIMMLGMKAWANSHINSCDISQINSQ